MDYCLIMAGGKGTRFWPLSRSKRPKQLLAMVSERTLLEEAVNRMKPLIPLERILIVTNEEQLAAVQKTLPKFPKKNILAEPLGRNTAACIGWGIQEIAKKDSQAGVVVLPADHHIPETELFVETLAKALSAAKTFKAPVTLGIRPTFPSTGYGYLKKGHPVKKIAGAYHLQSFHEKPDFKKAREYLAHHYLWNSGIFIWTVPVIQQAFKTYLPEHAAILEKIRKSPKSLKQLYPQFPSVSIDYGVMEKVKAAYLVEATFRWNDIGSWESLRDFWPEDSSQNASRREIVVIDSRGNLVEAPLKKIVALLGVKNLTVIDTPDALLIADKNRLQEVRQVVELLERKGKREAL
jgi:mannose-1-phosphate guanylyltransferase